MMGHARLVIVRRAELLLREEGLAGYLAAPCATTCLVLLGEKPDARLRSTRALAAAGVVCALSSPQDQALAAWLEREARRLGKQLAPGAAEHLVTYAGNALAPAAAELEKLALYVGEAREITVRDVEQAVADRGGAIVWKFTDALKARNAPVALVALGRYLSGFRRLDEALFPLMGMLRVELRMMMMAKEAGETGKLRGDALAVSLAKEWGRNDYRVKLAVRASARFSRHELLSRHRGLLEADRRLKSSNIPQRVLLESWVWRFCEKESPAGNAPTRPA